MTRYLITIDELVATDEQEALIFAQSLLGQAVEQGIQSVSGVKVQEVAYLPGKENNNDQ